MTAPPSAESDALAVLGGTGDQGRGLARRYALAGHEVVIGSRSAERLRSHSCSPNGLFIVGDALSRTRSCGVCLHLRLTSDPTALRRRLTAPSSQPSTVRSCQAHAWATGWRRVTGLARQCRR